MKKVILVTILGLSLAIPFHAYAEVITTSVTVENRPVTIESLQAEIARLTALLNDIQNNQSNSSENPRCLSFQAMSLGARGDEVVKLQEFLMTKSYVNWPVTVPATGYFGSITRNAVVDFQVFNSVIPSRTASGNGLIGPRTRAKIQELTCLYDGNNLSEEIEEMITEEENAPETPIMVEPVVPIRDSGLYVSISPDNQNNLSWESGDLGQVLVLRFEAVGFDIKLQNLGLDFTEGNVSGIDRLDVTNSAGVIIGSTNINDKLVNLDLSKEVNISDGSYEDIKFLAKVSDTTSLDEGRFSLNIDTANPMNTYGVRVDTGEVVYVIDPTQNTNQGVWLLDDKEDGSITVNSPGAIKTYSAGDQLEIKWYASGLLNDEDVKISILDKAGFLGKNLIPDFIVPNTQSYTWTIPVGLNPADNTFSVRISCTIHECYSDSLTQNLAE